MKITYFLLFFFTHISIRVKKCIHINLRRFILKQWMMTCKYKNNITKLYSY